MKRIAFFILVAIGLGSTLPSCDHVDNPFPQAYNTDLDTNLYPGNWSDYLLNDWPDFTTITADANRNVLIEDFTGHNCSNCPDAAEAAHNIHEANPSRVFVASIHASNEGPSSFQDVNTVQGYTVNFTNSVGLDLGYYFGTTLTGTGFFGNPGGTVNRRLEGTEYFYAYGFWATKTTETLNLPLDVSIKAKVNYYDATKGFFLHTEVEKVNSAIDYNDLSMVVYLIEDSLVAPQNVHSTFTPNYVHRDIMRGTLSGNPWGRPITSGDEVSGKYQLNYSYLVPDQLAPQGQATTFNAENMHLLIYVYDVNTYEILQVIKKEISN